MFQFPGFALLTLYIQAKSTWFRSDRIDHRNASRRSGRPACAGRSGHLTIEDCQVGFPIRTSRDQRVLSPPPGLSQSATSFIASCCQGIHQTPLSRLIRSRRRQALLRGAGSSANPSICLWSEVIDPNASPRQETRRLRVLERSLRDQTRPTVSVIRLGKTVLSSCTRSARSRTLPRTARRTDASAPTRERPKDVSCIALFTMSVAGCRHPAVSPSSRSRDRTGRLIVG